MKKILFVITLIFLFGCEDKKVEQKEVEKVTQAPQITVVENTLEQDKIKAISDKYDIHGNAIMSFAPDGNDNEVTKQIMGISTIKNNYENLNYKLLSQRLSVNYILKCSSCHDDYANGVIGPSLLTKTSDEIYSMIEAYRRATKVNVLMKYLVSQMEDEEIRALANEIHEFNKIVREQ